jgi:hypothetical protein
MTRVLKDSGSREAFSTGAVRDSQENKIRPGLLSPYAASRKAQIMALGAKKYTARNWEKGMEFSRVMESLERHLIAYKMGKTDEDHLAQLGWNVDALLHFEEVIKLGLLPANLDDLPRYEHAVRAVGMTNAKPPHSDSLGVPYGVGEKVDATRMSTNAFVKLLWNSPMSRHEIYRDVMLDLRCPGPVVSEILGGISYTRYTTAANEQQKIAYIAGPMRGYENFNFPAFDHTRNILLRKGWDVISPADIDRATDKNADDTKLARVDDQTRFVLRDFWSLYLIKKLGGGAICLLPDWHKSTGATGEIMLSRWLKLDAIRVGERKHLESEIVNLDYKDIVTDFALNQLPK